jgi:WXG100 family type VII secretion target
VSQPMVRTTEEGMKHAADQFGEKASSFTSDMQRINSEMATLQASWKGSASMTFGQAMDAWESAFQRVINELIGMMDSMGVNTQEYRSQEESAASGAASFAAALPGV